MQPGTICQISAGETFWLRRRIFGTVQTMQEAEESYRDFPAAVHFAICIDNETIIEPGRDRSQLIKAIGSFQPEDLPAVQGQAHPLVQKLAAEPGRQWRLRGLATDPAFRRQGMARRILQVGTSYIESKDAQLLWFFARAAVAGFYLRQGYHIHGRRLTIAGKGERFLMWRWVGEA